MKLRISGIDNNLDIQRINNNNMITLVLSKEYRMLLSEYATSFATILKEYFYYE